MGKKYIIFAVIGAILCIGVGVFVGRAGSPTTEAQTNTNASKDYPFLAKRIFIEDPNEPIVNFAPLRADLTRYLDENKLTGSLYFEYLPTGTSIRISGDDREGAASLMKVPAAMDLYRLAEMGKIDLDQKITLKEEWLDSGFGELYKQGAGHQLTLREAAKIMLEDSDNTALKAIAGTMGDQLTQENSSLSVLDVDFTQSNALTIKISARSYSSVIKCLYYSCFLNKDHSQEILNHLSNSKFNDRIVAGIDDKNIKVAHKIGVYNTTSQSDCGIVYLDKRNYILCVMLDGDRNPDTDKHIADISKKVYDYVKNYK